MTALPAAQRDRLARILGMLGSDHDGERAAAAAAASRLVREAGVTWRDILGPSPASIPLYRAPPDPRRPDVGWFADCELAQRHLSVLTQWERSFVLAISVRVTLTRNQKKALAGIAAGLRGRGLR